jgi:hypothetical protein
MLSSWVIEWSKSGMAHRCIFANFTHWAWAIWELCNHNLFWMIPNPGHQRKITLSLESISTIQFHAGTSYVRITEWGHHNSNCVVPYHVSILTPCRGPGIIPTTNQGNIFCIRWLCFRKFPILWYRSEGFRWPGELVIWVLSHAKMTATIVVPAGSWSCITHHQWPMPL